MLRTWILLFLPSIMMANLKESYMEDIRSTPRAVTGKPPSYTEKLAAYAEKPVKEIPVNKPITKPATKLDERKTKQQEYYLDIPVYVATELNFNKKKESRHRSLSPEFAAKLTDDAEAVLNNNRPTPFYDDLSSPESDENPINKEVNEETILPNKNNSPKQNQLLPTSTKPPNKVKKVQSFLLNKKPKPIYQDLQLSTEKPEDDEEETLQTITPKPIYEDLQLPVLDQIPVQKRVNKQAFVPHDAPNPFYNYIPIIPLTEKPEHKLINDEELLQTNRPKPFYEDDSLPISLEIPVHKQAFVPHDKPNSFYEYIKLKEEDFLHNKNPKSFNDFSLPIFTERPVTNKGSNQYFPEFPILTENPIDDQDFFSYDSPTYYKSKLPVLYRKPVQDQTDARKERLIKEKLVSLILSTRTDLDKHIQNIRSIHNTFKSGMMYKIGYLISLINKMNRRLTKLYTSVQNNKHKWDSLKILDTYEKVKSNSELVRDMVSLMRAFLRVKRKSDQELKSPKEPGERKNDAPNKAGISWSYYDESLP